MTERPILFSAPMVRALLDGRKTQTRRIVKPRDLEALGVDDHGAWLYHADGAPRPYGEAGDLLWARERWATWMHAPSLPEGLGGALSRDPGDWLYAATDPEWDAMDHDRRALKAHNARSEDGRAGNYVIRNSIHMPRWASRITLLVTDVRVERLNEISEADAIAEGVEQRLVVCADSAERNLWFGVPHAGHESAVQAYADLWDSINNPRGYCGEDEPHGWDANPWVWAVSFERVEQAQRSAA